MATLYVIGTRMSYTSWYSMMCPRIARIEEACCDLQAQLVLIRKQYRDAFPFTIPDAEDVPIEFLLLHPLCVLSHTSF
ncbi:unnamed protein product [Rotaria socialis]